MKFKLTTPLPDYNELKDFLEIERKTLVKNSAFSEEDDYIRSVEDASNVLDSLAIIQELLWRCFDKNPSLMGLFDNEFASFKEFINRDNILELCFLDNYIFTEKELFLFCDDETLSARRLSECEDFFRDWIEKKEKAHVQGQHIIRQSFSIDTKYKDIGCQCVSCIADYRTKLREAVFKDCVDLIEETEGLIESDLEQNLKIVSRHFYKKIWIRSFTKCVIV